jgi:hypothetical protein
MVERQPPAPAVWQLSICLSVAGCMGAGLDSLTASAIPPKDSPTNLDGGMTDNPGSAPIVASADTATILRRAVPVAVDAGADAEPRGLEESP